MEGIKALRRIETIAHQLDSSSPKAPIAPQPTAALPTQEEYDVIIVGGGIHGSATADELSRKGKKVLLLEQFDVNHEEGSSHGDGRIIRFAYPEKIYIDMAKIAYPLWKDIEKRHGNKVTQITGGITFGPPEDADLQALIQNLKLQNVPCEVLTPDQANKRFPIFNIPQGNVVVYQKDSGVAFASKAVKALWDLAQKQGARLLSNEKVVGLRIISAEKVEVTTQSGKKFSGKKLVLTVGAWAETLLKQINVHIPLTITQEQVFYWKEKEQNLRHHMDNMPVFIVHGKDHFYGLPQIDIPGVKIGWHYSGHKIDIENKKVPIPDENRERTVSKFVSQVFPELAHEKPIHTLYCLYATTTDAHFVIDYHPTYKNVIIGSPCSGHGFKFGPAIGAILAGMASGEKPMLPLDQFKLSRFAEGVTKRKGV